MVICKTAVAFREDVKEALSRAAEQMVKELSIDQARP